MNKDSPSPTSGVVDARGLSCPQPVILTRRAMAESAVVTTIVNSETSLNNVRRMAERAGWRVAVHTDGAEHTLYISDAAAAAEEPSNASASGDRPAAVPLVLVVSEDKMGRGPAELGDILVRSFFYSLGEIDHRPQTVIFLNTGVRLVIEGSPIVENLGALAEQGVSLLACGTCLDYFDLRDQLAVGRISNMYDIAETMMSAGKVVML